MRLPIFENFNQGQKELYSIEKYLQSLAVDELISFKSFFSNSSRLDFSSEIFTNVNRKIFFINFLSSYINGDAITLTLFYNFYNGVNSTYPYKLINTAGLASFYNNILLFNNVEFSVNPVSNTTVFQFNGLRCEIK